MPRIAKHAPAFFIFFQMFALHPQHLLKATMTQDAEVAVKPRASDLMSIRAYLAPKKVHQSCGRSANSVTSRFVSRSCWANQTRIDSSNRRVSTANGCASGHYRGRKLTIRIVILMPGSFRQVGNFCAALGPPGLKFAGQRTKAKAEADSVKITFHGCGVFCISRKEKIRVC